MPTEPETDSVIETSPLQNQFKSVEPDKISIEEESISVKTISKESCFGKKVIEIILPERKKTENEPSKIKFLIDTKPDLSINSSQKEKQIRKSSIKPNESSTKSMSLKEFYESPSVGVGILLVHKDKILLGRRIDSGMYGLPGGWLEFCEEWNECAARELKEETGIDIPSESFKHIYTINSINKEKKYHSVSNVMFGFMDESQMKNLENKEPNKCYGWF